MSRESERKVVALDSDEVAYLRFFHLAVTAGVICGLEHPIAWAVNAWRTPGATLDPEYYERTREQLPRFLCEMFELLSMKVPESADEVLVWCDKHYEKSEMFLGFFEFLRPRIDQYLKEKGRS